MTDVPFPLYPQQALRARPLNTDWRVRAASRAEGEHGGFDRPAPGVDEGWDVVDLPHTGRATAHDETRWYRRGFRWDSPAPTGHAGQLRRVLRFGAAFLDATVWLNGVELGRHYGHFAPFAFDVTDLLRAADNRLAVCVTTPVELGDPRRKLHVMGVRNDWDCKPYPNRELGRLPETAEFAWWLPVGLPLGVDLLDTAPVVAGWLRVETRFETPTAGADSPESGPAHVAVTVQLRNLGLHQAPFTIAATLAECDDGPAAGPGFAEPASGLLAAGEAREVTLHGTVASPRRWWPWTHGEPTLYRLALRLETGGTHVSIEQAVGLRDVRLDLDATPGAERAVFTVNGRRIFPKGTNYLSEFDPAAATPARLAADLSLMRAANVDLVRVHAHVEPPAFYELADRLGLLVMQDLPLTFTYAWQAEPADHAAFRERALTQATEAAQWLQPHPSVAFWAAHNEPPWPAELAYVGAAHLAGWNRDVDEAAAAIVRHHAPGSTVLPASGDLDEHRYLGWYAGSADDARDRPPRFVTEFGAQALPDLDSPVWSGLTQEWPVDPNDPTWLYAGYQPVYWARFGVGEPAEWPSLAEYAAASQAYQAWLLRWLIDRWRIAKFRPTGGLVQFMFGDCHPGITWSVVDHARRPKLGFAALRDAYEPTHLALDFAGHTVRDRFRLHWSADAPVRFDVWLVNDDYTAPPGATLDWELVGGPPTPPLRGLFATLAGDRRRGRSNVAMPPADGGAVQVAAVETRLPAGEWSLRATLRAAGRTLSAVDQPFTVGEAHAGTGDGDIVVPGFLIARLYRRGTLRPAPDAGGFAFDLWNQLQHATLTDFLRLRVDGRDVPPERVTIHAGGWPRPAPTITPDAPIVTEVGHLYRLEVAGEPLTPGEHEIEVVMRVVGFGDALVRFRDRLQV